VVEAELMTLSYLLINIWEETSQVLDIWLLFEIQEFKI